MNEHRETGNRAAPEHDTPGDPVCWLKRVCPKCGALAATDPPATCPRCHAVMPPG
jgi:hypothetical protein